MPDSIAPTTEEYKRSTLLTKFYDRVAGTLAGVEECVRISKFAFGHGFVDESTSPRPTFQPVPNDLAELPGEFFSGVPEMVKADGRVLVRCHLQKGAVEQAAKFSMIGLYDAQGNLLAVMQDLPDWITPSDSHTAYGYLDFPHLGENPPEVF